VRFDRPPHAAAPAAADVEQRHARLKVQLAKGEIELGVLRLVERHIVAFEVCAGVPRIAPGQGLSCSGPRTGRRLHGLAAQVACGITRPDTLI
jgi:hypothetical protein